MSGTLQTMYCMLGIEQNTVLLCQGKQFTVGAISPSASHPSQIIFGQIASMTNCSYLTNGSYLTKCNWPPCTIWPPSNKYEALCANILQVFHQLILETVFILKMHVIVFLKLN